MAAIRKTAAKARSTAARPAKADAPRDAARKAPAQWNARKREKFLQTLAETANVAESARAVGMSRTAVYTERKRNADFAAAWSLAINAAMDELELTLLGRATYGVEKDVYYAGEKRGTVRQYSDALAMFLLRAHRPEVYGKAAGDSEGASASADDVRALIEARLSALGTTAASDTDDGA